MLASSQIASGRALPRRAPAPAKAVKVRTPLQPRCQWASLAIRHPSGFAVLSAAWCPLLACQRPHSPAAACHAIPDTLDCLLLPQGVRHVASSRVSSSRRTLVVSAAAAAPRGDSSGQPSSKRVATDAAATAEAPTASPIMSKVEMWNGKKLQTQVFPLAKDTTAIRSLDWERDRFDIEFG